MAIINYENLPNLGKKNSNKKIVFCSGSFDLLHAGHVLFLDASKKLGDVLIVAVGKDKDINKNKGLNRPIINEQMRLKIIDALKSVDYSFINNSPPDGKDFLYPIEELFGHFKPDIWTVNYDASEIEKRKLLAKKFNIDLRILELDRNNPEYAQMSTTAIIKKIKGLK